MGRTTDETGITLVEVMVSLLILGVVLTAFFRVITGGLQSLTETRAAQTSSQLATEIIEDLRRLSPSEIAMYNDPLATESDEFDPATVSCVGSGAGYFDPDGAGPMGCEEIVTASQGAITSDAPFQTTYEGVTVTTIATVADDPDVPDDTVRVTVLLVNSVTGTTEEIRRSALFSEVSRG